MAGKKSMWVLRDILVITALVLGSAIQVGAETMNYKFYRYVIKEEPVRIGDVEGHALSLTIRGGFCVFQNGEVATSRSVVTADVIKHSGSSIGYETITFADGSTIIIKSTATLEGVAGVGLTSSKTTREITKGTGRFEGITGTGTTKVNYLPVEKGEPGQKAYGEATLTYTLPSK
jgi:hypothetical protein